MDTKLAKASHVSQILSCLLAAITLAIVVWPLVRPAQQFLPGFDQSAGMTIYWLLGGLGLCILGAAGLHLASVLVARKPNGEKRVSTVPSSRRADTNHEDCQRQIRNLESTVTRLREHEVTQSVQISARDGQINALQAKLDERGWLVKIADLQAADLSEWMEVEKVDWYGADLLRARPYLQFWLFIKNCSVFKVTLSEPHGSIHYASESIRGSLQWLKQPPGILPGAFNDEYVLQLEIEDQDDLRRILNVNSGFSFGNLDIEIRDTQQKAESRSLSFPAGPDFTWLREKHPKLKMEICEAQLWNFWDVKKDNTLENVGSVVNVRLRFENEGRDVPVRISSFKLDTNPNIKRVTNAEMGKIWERPSMLAHDGERLHNLNRVPMEAGRHQPFEGWLQFIIEKVHPSEFNGVSATVIITAESGEEHHIATPALQRFKGHESDSSA